MTVRLLITPERFMAGDFDSRRRFLRSGVSGTFLPIAHGKTIDCVPGSFFGGSGMGLRYSVNGLVRQQTLRVQGLLGNEGMSSGSFNATVTLVKF